MNLFFQVSYYFTINEFQVKGNSVVNLGRHRGLPLRVVGGFGRAQGPPLRINLDKFVYGGIVIPPLQTLTIRPAGIYCFSLFLCNMFVKIVVNEHKTVEGVMKRFFRVVAICAAGIIMGAGAIVYSQYNQTETDSTIKKEPEKKWLYGSVSQVAFAKGFIKLFNDQGYTTIEVNDKTIITIEGKKTGLDELSTEDSVRVLCYIPEPGRYVAISITKS